MSTTPKGRTNKYLDADQEKIQRRAELQQEGMGLENRRRQLLYQIDQVDGRLEDIDTEIKDLPELPENAVGPSGPLGPPSMG